MKFNKLDLFVFLGVALLLIFSVFHHVMWRDELQVWMVVRESPSIESLFHNLKFEWHPAAWYVLVWILQRFFDNPF